ncbi:hypothetical protein H6G26_38690 [Nostoc sp. FACHB-888]|nr:hypothetical protein [Nostoc sp. FACHB-888]
MTHHIYSHQQLQLKSIARLKQIYSEIGCTVEVSDKRCKDAWITAIVNYQASKIQKVTLPALDNQAAAQAELDGFITAQAQAIAPEPLTTVEISFYYHEFYAGFELVATITHDDDLTQPWVVMVNSVEKFRANTWARCERFINWHHQDRTLNERVPAQTETLTEEPCTTGNEIMAQIFNECEKYGFEILDDGIYKNNMKLGEVGHTDGCWWFTRAADATQRIPCDSALDAVYWLSMVDTMLDAEAADCEELLDRPFDELTPDEWQRLREYAPLQESRELVAV